jgi:DNA polymerase-3 subunit alpha
MKNYIDLINFSNYSIGKGMQTIDELIMTAKREGRDYISLTDHNTLSGIPELVDKCNKNNLKPIIGTTISCKKDDVYIGDVSFVAKNQKGFDDLKELVSELGAFKNTEERLLDIEIIKKYISKGNIFCIEGAKNSIIFNIENEEDYYKVFSELQKSAGSNLLGTIQTQMDEEKTTKISRKLLKSIHKGFNENNIKTHLFFSNNNRFFNKSDYVFQMNKMHNFSHLTPSLKKSKGMLPDGIIDRTDTPLPKSFLEKKLSKFYVDKTKSFFITDSIIKKFSAPEIFKPISFPKLYQDENLKDIISEKWETFKTTIPKEKIAKYRKRIDDELELFEEMGFSDYFVVVNAFSKNAAKQGDVNAIRGSGAASLVVHMLGLSQVDPVEHDLMFARFMNKGRVSDPDLDVETSDNDGMMQMLKIDYGQENIANLMSTDTMQNANVTTKFAFESIRRYGKKDQEFKQSMNQVENNIKQKLSFYKKSPPNVSTLLANNFYWQKDYKSIPNFKIIVDECIKLENQITNKKLSIGTIILSNESLMKTSSLIKSNKEIGSDYYLEVTKDYIQQMGHLKMDILSSKILEKLKISSQLASVDLQSILKNLKNPDIYKAISDGYIANVNQINSKMKLEKDVTDKNKQGIGYTICKEVKPKNFEELTAIMALIRMGSETDGKRPEQLQKYLDGKADPESIKYKHDSLKDILSKTYGAIIFEEQIMRISTNIANFNETEADNLRSVIKKENAEELEEIKPIFIKKAIENNISIEVATSIFKDIEEKMGQYQFNEAHACVYASIAYQQMYMKLNHPAEFYSAHYEDTNKEIYENEMLNLNIYVQRPDINNSLVQDQTLNIINKAGNKKVVDFSIKKVIKDEDMLKDILSERKRLGYFEDIFDYTERVLPLYTDCNLMSLSIDSATHKISKFKSDTENLILIGAFDKINIFEGEDLIKNRVLLIENLDIVIDSAKNQHLNQEIDMIDKTDKFLSPEDIIKKEEEFLNISPFKMRDKALEKKNIEKVNIPPKKMKI